MGVAIEDTLAPLASAEKFERNTRMIKKNGMAR